jgi:DNA polymerase III subunit beta
MKIIVAKEPLLHVVTAISGIVPAKSTMPILYNILIEAQDGQDGFLRLAGTDLDISISYRMKATIEKPGAITIPAKKFVEIVRTLPNSPITIEQTKDKVKIVCEKSSLVLPGLPKSDFPAFPEKSFDEAFKVSNAVMRKLVLNSSYSAGKDEDRQILKGVLWEIGKEEQSMVSTNGHRLAKMSIKENVGMSEAMSVVVPPKALEQVDRLCGEDGELEIVMDGNYIGIREGDVVIFSRLIEGTYPNYEQVIPFYNNKVALVDNQKLSDALRRMLILSNVVTHRIRLFFKDNQLQVSVSTEEVGEGEDLMEAEYQDEEIEIFFNGNYLLEVLKYIESEQVKICMETSESGILIVPAQEKENERYLGVIMPLKVTDR